GTETPCRQNTGDSGLSPVTAWLPAAGTSLCQVQHSRQADAAPEKHHGTAYRPPAQGIARMPPSWTTMHAHVPDLDRDGGCAPGRHHPVPAQEPAAEPA